MGAMLIGEPGCPDSAACTASMLSVRMVLIASFSMAEVSLATARPVVSGMSPPSVAPTRSDVKRVRREFLQIRMCLPRIQLSAVAKKATPASGVGRHEQRGELGDGQLLQTGLVGASL